MHKRAAANQSRSQRESSRTAQEVTSAYTKMPRRIILLECRSTERR
jgi:hypothetical protein